MAHVLERLLDVRPRYPRIFIMRYFAQRCTKTELRRKNLYVDPLVEPPIITKFEAKRTRSKIEAEDAADRALQVGWARRILEFLISIFGEGLNF